MSVLQKRLTRGTAYEERCDCFQAKTSVRGADRDDGTSKTKAGLGAVISWANLLSIQRTKVNYETPT